MTPAQIIAQAKRYVGVNLSADITDDVWYDNLNYVYNDFYNKIVALYKNYFWTYWTADIVDGQNEYTLKPSTSGTFGQNKIDAISIKVNSTDTYYTLMQEKDFDGLPFDESYYRLNQPKESPFYVIADNSLFIYPAPIADLTAGIKFEGTRLVYDLTSSMNETNILIPPTYHNILVLGTVWRTYNYLRVDREEQKKNIEYNEQLRQSLNELEIRVTNPVYGKSFDMTNLE